MKVLRTLLRLTTPICVCVIVAVSSASAQLAPNQTNGFGNKRLVTFTYNQNFDCVDQPTMDLDFNKIPAQSDPNEMQKNQFARQSLNLKRIQPEETSSKLPTCMYWFRCSRSTMIKIRMTRCYVQMEDDPANSVAPTWALH